MTYKKDTSGQGAGNELSHWATPAWCTVGLLHFFPEILQGQILEPQAGSGGIVEPLLDAGGIVDALEIRRECEERLKKLGCRQVAIGDFRQQHFGERVISNTEYWAIVSNPPYRPAPIMLQHVETMLSLRPKIAAALLPLSFLSGGSGRSDFWRHAPPLTQLLFFSDRPAFAEQGGMFECAWFVWKRLEEPKAAAMIEMPKAERKAFAW